MWGFLGSRGLFGVVGGGINEMKVGENVIFLCVCWDWCFVWFFFSMDLVGLRGVCGVWSEN